MVDEQDTSEEPDELKMLFKKFPGLRQQLLTIAEATDPPPPTNSGPGNAFGKYDSHKKQKPWTKDIGYQNGVSTLRRALNEDPTGGVQEYCELMKIINARKDAEAADASFRRQIAERDAQHIGQLIQEEKN
jgi:hypothetical protein